MQYERATSDDGAARGARHPRARAAFVGRLRRRRRPICRIRLRPVLTRRLLGCAPAASDRCIRWTSRSARHRPATVAMRAVARIANAPLRNTPSRWRSLPLCHAGCRSAAPRTIRAIAVRDPPRCCSSPVWRRSREPRRSRAAHPSLPRLAQRVGARTCGRSCTSAARCSGAAHAARACTTPPVPMTRAPRRACAGAGRRSRWNRRRIAAAPRPTRA